MKNPRNTDRRTIEAMRFLAGPEPNQSVVDLHLDLTWRVGRQGKEVDVGDADFHGCELRLYYVETERQAAFRQELQRRHKADFLPQSQATLNDASPAQGRVLYELAAHSPYEVAFRVGRKSSIDPPQWLVELGYQPLAMPREIEYRFVDIHGNPTSSFYFPRCPKDVKIAAMKLRRLLDELDGDPQLAAMYRDDLDTLINARRRLTQWLERHQEDPNAAREELGKFALRFCIEPFTVNSAETWTSWCDLDEDGRARRRGDVRKILADPANNGFYFAAVVRRDPNSLLAQALGIASAYLVDPPGTVDGSSGGNLYTG